MAVDTIARALAIKAQQGGGSGETPDYQELTNKPSINGVVLEGNKTSSDLGLVSNNDYVKTYVLDYHSDLNSEDNINILTSIYNDFVNNVPFNVLIWREQAETFPQFGSGQNSGTLIACVLDGSEISLGFIGGNVSLDQVSNYGVNYFSTRFYTITFNNTKQSATKTNIGLALLAGSPMFLGTSNTTAYTPTNDYNPATKKYVDDCIKSNQPIYWDGEMDDEGNALAMFQEAYNYYLENGKLTNIIFKRTTGIGQINFLPLVNMYLNQNGTEVDFVFASISYVSNTYIDPTLFYKNYRFNINDGVLSFWTSVTYDAFGFEIAHVWNGSNTAYGGCLDIQNTSIYTPTSDYNPATKKYVDDLVSTISTLSFQVVTELPTTDIQTNIIYLVPSTTSSEQNVYDEYIYINSTWEKIGSTAIDLSNYLAKDNTTAYTPTSDYNPATKQYVDSSVTNQATTEETISGLKTFTTLPESSVVPTTNNQLVNKAYVDSTLSTTLGNINTILATLTTVSEVTE